MYKYLLLLSLPLIASEAPDDASSSSLSSSTLLPTCPVPIRVRPSATPRVDYPTYAPNDFSGRAPETAPIGTPPSTPQPARILRARRNLLGFARSLPVEILAPGMIISLDSSSAVYKRGNRIEIRIQQRIDIDEDHSGDASE